MNVKRVLFITAVIALLCVPSADAQFAKSWKDWYGHFQGGYNAVNGDAADVVKDGWTIGGGATYYPDDWAFGISLGLDYMENDIERAILDEFEASGGDVDVWALTTGLTWSPRMDGAFGFYINAGIGGYRLEGKLKEPGVVCGPICPPWSWWCYPGCAPGTVITDSVSTTKFGYNLGVGIGFEVGQGSMIYLEAKYHRIETDTATTMIPVVVGYRW
jgi:opacity protein-like surface antigen